MFGANPCKEHSVAPDLMGAGAHPASEQNGITCVSAHAVTVPNSANAPSALNAYVANQEPALSLDHIQGQGEGGAPVAATGFPEETFRGPFAAMAAVVAASMPVPREIPFVIALSIMSALTGKRVEAFNRMTARKTPGNLFVVVSAPTGSGKSSSGKELIKPLKALQKEVIEAWETSACELRAERKRLSGQAHPLRTKGKVMGDIDAHASCQPASSMEAERRIAEIDRLLQRGAPKWLDGDPTPEALTESMGTWNECGYIFNTEAEGLLQIMSGKHSRGDSRFGVFCALFSGDDTGGRRIGRESYPLQDPRLTVYLAAQPDLTLKLRFGEESRNRGLAGRFLWIAASQEPLIDPEHPFPSIPEEVRTRYATVCRTLFERYSSPSSTCPLVQIPFEEEAGRYLHRRAAMDQRNRLQGAPNSEIRVRSVELISRVALNLHLMEHGLDGERIEISMDTVLGAERFYEWALRSWAEQEEDEADKFYTTAVQKTLEILDEQGNATARTIYRAMGVSAAQAKYILTNLVEGGYIAEIPPSPECKSTRYCRV